jgi:hypothetical protein
MLKIGCLHLAEAEMRFQFFRALSVAALLIAGSQLGAQEVKPSWPIPPDLKWQPVNGYPMAYRDVGSGVPIVLVHGSATDYRNFTAQLQPLSARRRL